MIFRCQCTQHTWKGMHQLKKYTLKTKSLYEPSWDEPSLRASDVKLVSDDSATCPPWSMLLEIEHRWTYPINLHFPQMIWNMYRNRCYSLIKERDIVRVVGIIRRFADIWWTSLFWKKKVWINFFSETTMSFRKILIRLPWQSPLKSALYIPIGNIIDVTKISFFSVDLYILLILTSSTHKQ